jgi:hypothetical protein
LKQGFKPIVKVESCYISDMYSFCSVIEPEDRSSAVVTIADSAIYDVQVGMLSLLPIRTHRGHLINLS